MSDTEDTRKDFADWKVAVVYMAQEGVCINSDKPDGCGNTLANGFHRHHKNGNNADDSVQNLELRCPECHHATYTGAKQKNLAAHRRQERKIFGQLNSMIAQMTGSESKIAGATAERLLEAMSLSLKMSKQMNHIGDDLEYPPPSVSLFKKMLEEDTLKDTLLEGYKLGVEAVKLTVANLKQPSTQRRVSYLKRKRM